MFVLQCFSGAFRVKPCARHRARLPPSHFSFSSVLPLIVPKQEAPELQIHLDKFDILLQKAEHHTFNCPTGQLYGRAGRRCTLEDAERMLEIYIQERPCDLRARVVLLRNLMRQGLGRERDVPWWALQALHESNLSDCNIYSSSYIKVLQIVLLGLKALYKLEAESGAIPADPLHPALTRSSFMAAVQAAVPGMSHDLTHMADRLERKLSSCNPDSRLLLLSQRNGWMSCVDLQAVSGRHHALAGALAEADLLQHNPRALEQMQL